jgi:hypothetical protein
VQLPARRKQVLSRGAARLLVSSLSIMFITLLIMAKGFNVQVPIINSDGGKSKATDKVPSVSIKGAIACKQSNSSIVNLNTEERVKACADAKKYAKGKLAKTYKGSALETQFGCLDQMWDHESDWSAWAINPSSGAYGIAQTIPGIHDNQPPHYQWKPQVDWGLGYIASSYDTPCKAWAFWQRTDARCMPKAGSCNHPYGKHWY